MTNYITVQVAVYANPVPTTQAALKKYFNDEKDFQILSVGRDYGRYLSKRDLKPGDKLEIRYGKNNEKVVILP